MGTPCNSLISHKYLVSQQKVVSGWRPHRWLKEPRSALLCGKQMRPGKDYVITVIEQYDQVAFSALTLLGGRQKGNTACKNW